MSVVLVCGAGGFIGGHLVTRLKNEGHFVVGVDINYPQYNSTRADVFINGDLRSKKVVDDVFGLYQFDWVFQLAADMGGAGYIFTGDQDSDIMYNSSMINLNIAKAAVDYNISKILYTSSACVYPARNQEDPDHPDCSEDSAYPAAPDSEYGWEKLFSERLYTTFAKNHGLDIRIARLHNVFGPYGAWANGKEKAPAALCRKVAMSADGVVEIWGSGQQTRSFLYIDDCIDGIMKLFESDVTVPLNIGSDRMISINNLAELIATISGKEITIKNLPGPTGVMGRNSDNTKIRQLLNWAPPDNLEYGLEQTYEWICSQINKGDLK